ncbi:terpene synthase family protein [Streptomyces aureoversilis]|uniref:Terpene synthase n=1 Tax=Streptomyces aureoversilis TaxID=67277 RepID=A0ABW0A6K2_9ACTN
MRRRNLFFCPLPLRISPDAERARAHTWEWCQETGMAASPEAAALWDAYRLDLWGSCVWWYCTGDLLDLVTDWGTWGVMLDDVLEVHDPELIRDTVDEMKQIFDTNDPDAPGAGAGPFTVALSDLWRRTQAHGMSVRWQRRTANRFSRFLDSYLRDAVYRRDDVWPTVEHYLDDRIWSTASLANMCFNDLEHRCELSDDIVMHPVLHAMQRATGDHIALVNDITGVHREASWNDHINVVPLIQRQYRCTQGEAIARAVTMADQRMHSFLALERALPDLCAHLDVTPEERECIGHLTRGLRSWLSGNIEYHLISPRYEERPRPASRHTAAWMADAHRVPARIPAPVPVPARVPQGLTASTT